MVFGDGTEAFDSTTAVNSARLNQISLWVGTSLPVGAANKVPKNGKFLLVDDLDNPTTAEIYLQTSATLSSPNFVSLGILGGISGGPRMNQVELSTDSGDYDLPSSYSQSSTPSATNQNDDYDETLADTVMGLNGALSSVYDQRCGLKVLTSHALVGKYVTTAKATLQRVGSITGNIVAVVRDSSQTVKKTSDAIDVATMSTSYTEITFTFSGGVQIAVGDRIQLEYSGGDTTNYINPRGGNITSATNTEETSYSGSTQTDRTTKTPTMTITAQDNQPSGSPIDGDLNSKIYTDQETNPWLRVDLGSSKEVLSIALAKNSLMTETEIQIQISNDDSTWETVRTILASKLTNDAVKYIQLVRRLARYVRIRGSSGDSGVLGVSEIGVRDETADYCSRDQWSQNLSPTDTSLNLDGT